MEWRGFRKTHEVTKAPLVCNIYIYLYRIHVFVWYIYLHLVDLYGKCCVVNVGKYTIHGFVW